MKERQKKFFITIISVVILNLFFASLCYFLFLFTNSKKVALVETKSQIVEYEERIKNMNELLDGLVYFEKQRAGISSLFLNKTSVVNFFEELEYLARKTGVSLVMKGVVVTDNPETKPTFRFSVEGFFPEIYHFLYLLEHDVYYVEFEKVDVLKGKDGGGWEANFVLKLLSFKN